MNGAAGIAYYLLRVALLTGDPKPLVAADQWRSALRRSPRSRGDL